LSPFAVRSPHHHQHPDDPGCARGTVRALHGGRWRRLALSGWASRCRKLTSASTGLTAGAATAMPAVTRAQDKTVVSNIQVGPRPFYLVGSTGKCMFRGNRRPWLRVGKNNNIHNSRQGTPYSLPAIVNIVILTNPQPRPPITPKHAFTCTPSTSHGRVERTRSHLDVRHDGLVLSTSDGRHSSGSTGREKLPTLSHGLRLPLNMHLPVLPLLLTAGAATAMPAVTRHDGLVLSTSDGRHSSGSTGREK
jgi:hypothetical protein